MITLEANYAKKIGLPGYSSHQFCITLKSELTDLAQAGPESARLYAVLQRSVDENIRQVGYLPGASPSASASVNGNSNSNGNGNGNGNGHHPVPPENDRWNCSPKQKELVLKITADHQLDKAKVDELAQERFGKGVKQLNKLEASGLIEELLEQTGQTPPRHERFQKAGAR